jgi:hypothetical protein
LLSLISESSLGECWPVDSFISESISPPNSETAESSTSSLAGSDASMVGPRTTNAQTWRRMAAKRKQALASAVADRLAAAISDALEETAEDPAEIVVKSKATRRGESDYFDIEIGVDYFDGDERTALAVIEVLASLLRATTESQPGDADHWPMSYLKGCDLRQILVTCFLLETEVGG